MAVGIGHKPHHGRRNTGVNRDQPTRQPRHITPRPHSAIPNDWLQNQGLITGILDALTAGVPVDEIVEHYPTLTADDVRAAAAYDALLAT